jgi:hypothetical protein
MKRRALEVAAGKNGVKKQCCRRIDTPLRAAIDARSAHGRRAIFIDGR